MCAELERVHLGWSLHLRDVDALLLKIRRTGAGHGQVWVCSGLSLACSRRGNRFGCAASGGRGGEFWRFGERWMPVEDESFLLPSLVSVLLFGRVGIALSRSWLGRKS